MKGTKLAVVLLGGLLGLSAAEESPVVKTPKGKLRGLTLTSRSGRQFHAFLGVPYARPPLGYLRFQPPLAREPWIGMRDAKTDAPFCLQISIFDPTHTLQGQEDCLYLSIFTPNTSGRAPVLVHFHGGAYTMGNNRIYGAQYLMDEEIVMVTVNYRVAIFGFLSFESEELPGNQGMKDQVLALRWVQENIHSFGGDPGLVTIIGESAGAGSVNNHIVSPLSKGLFHRAIGLSGSSYSPWSLAPPGHARGLAEKLAGLLACPKTPKEALACFLNKDSREIAAKFTEFLAWQIDPVLNFGPVLEPPGDGAFLVGPVSQWQHNPVPLILSLNSAEGLLKTGTMLMFKTDFHWLSENFDRLAPMSLGYFASASKPEEITKELRKFYLPDEEISMKDWVNLTTIYTDAWFAVGSVDAANLHKGIVYFYFFDYIMSGKGLFTLPPELNFGAFHCSDMGLIWNLSVPIIPNIASEEETRLSQQFIKLLVNFMKLGNPSGEGQEIEWTPWNMKERNYLNIDKTGFQMKTGLLRDRYEFWKSLKYRDNYN